MISINFQNVSAEPQKPSTKIYSYQNNYVVKVLTSNNQAQLLSNMEEVFRNSNHTHPNIVSCAGYNTQVINETQTKLYVLYPAIKQSLAGLLNHHVQNKTHLSTEELHHHFDALLSAGEYLEEQGIRHKNIKPENILLDQFNTIKVTEMGSGSVAKLKVLNTLYVAPEISQKESMDDTEWHKADVWSVGMVMLEMCDLENTTKSTQTLSPFAYADNVFGEIYNRIERVKRMTKGGVELAEILSLMLNPDSSSRPTFKQTKWLFFDKIVCHGISGDSDQVNHAPADGEHNDAAGSDEERGVGEDSEHSDESPLLHKSEEAKEDLAYFTQLKESQQLFYDIFFAKFLDKFSLISNSKTFLHISMKTAKQRQNPAFKQPNLKELIPTLTKITVKSVSVTDDDLAVLAAGLLLFNSVPDLILDFRDAKLSDKGLCYLSDFCLNYFKNLKIFHIYTNSPQVTDKSVAALARGPLRKMTGLRSLMLYFGRTQVTDAMFDMVRIPVMNMKDLISLQFWVFSTQITDASIRMLCSQVLFHKTELQTLCLGLTNTKITNASIQELTYVVLPRLTKLKTLYLHIALLPLTEDVLLNLFKYGLGTLTGLETVNLCLTSLKVLSDGLFEQMIEVGLGNKPNIKALTLYAVNTKITNKAVTDIFYKLLPRLNNLTKFELSAKNSKIDNKVIEQVKHLPFFDKCKINL